MKNRLKFSTLFAAFMLISSSASASYFLWNSANNDFSLSYPDNWQMQNPRRAYSQIRIVSPLTKDRAECHVEAKEDNRLNIYPKTMMTKAVEENMGKDYWEEKLSGMYKLHNLTEFYSPSIMGGRGDATAVRYSFKSDDDKYMYGAMIGSIYGGREYIVECKSLRNEFDKYAELFSRIMESVQLEQKYHPFAIGYYRDFLHDRKFKDLDDKPGTKHHKGKFSLRSLWPYSSENAGNQ